jgi:hypothetical protein
MHSGSQFYVGNTVSDDDDGSSVSSSASSSDSEDSHVHDGRMQAFDEWRSALQAWVPGPGRNAPPSAKILTPRPTAGMAPSPSAADIPSDLRANDIKRHILNIDSQFRETPESTTSSDFYYRILTTVRNVIRIRITSIEFPNNYPFFTEARKNVTLRVITGGGSTTTDITIEDGNYTALDMEDALNTAFSSAGLGIVATWNEITGKFTFVRAAGGIFSFDTTYLSYNRPFAYGLGYYIGFSRGTHDAVASTGTSYTLVSTQCANFAGDPYVFLKVNDFDCVRHTMEENDFTALAKIVLREPKNYMAFDDYASQHIKEVVFHNPRDLSRFHIQVLDPYGEVIDMCSAQFSFSMEVLEIQNQSLFDTVRESMMLQYV